MHNPNVPVCDNPVVPVLLTKDAIRAVFAAAVHQQDYVVGLHKLVYGEVWGRIAVATGYCRCSVEMNHFIFDLAMAWDARLPNVMKGGAWMNWGFSSVGMPATGWEIIPAPYTLLNP